MGGKRQVVTPILDARQPASSSKSIPEITVYDIVSDNLHTWEATDENHVHFLLCQLQLLCGSGRQIKKQGRCSRKEIAATWQLHHDKALHIRELLAKHSLLMLLQLSYSSELAPTDLFLFPKIKTALEETALDSLKRFKLHWQWLSTRFQSMNTGLLNLTDVTLEIHTATDDYQQRPTPACHGTPYHNIHASVHWSFSRKLNDIHNVHHFIVAVGVDLYMETWPVGLQSESLDSAINDSKGNRRTFIN
ncbi:hypothetical protein Trydic_g9542 [Trypoxylus dichotomus]